MNNIFYQKTFAYFNIVAGIIIPVWWILMGTILPVQEAATNFEILILHPNWVIVNTIGLLGCFAWLISLPIFYLYRYDKPSNTGFWGLILSTLGVAWFSCIQYYETFLWPVVAKTNPELVKFDGALVFGDKLIVTPLIISGIVLSVGYILMMINLSKKQPSVSVLLIIMILFGALLFANGIIIPIRSLGLISLSISMIWISLKVLKERK